MQGQRDAASGAVGVAGAVARVLHVLVAVLGVERDQAQPVREELVRYHRGVLLDLDHIDRERRHLREHSPSESIRKGEVDIAEFKVDAIWLGLEASGNGQ